MTRQVCFRRGTAFSALVCLGIYIYTYHMGSAYLQKIREYTRKIICQKNLRNVTENLFHGNGCFDLSWNLTHELTSVSGESAHIGIMNNIILNELQKHSLNKSFCQSLSDGGECKLFLTKTKFKGRLGNQMFQYSSLLGMACEFDYIPIIKKSVSVKLQKYFDIPYIANVRLKDLKMVECIGNMYTKHYNCSSYLRNQSEGIFDIAEEKYLQSWKYFQKCSSVVKQALLLKQKHIQSAREFISTNTRGWNTKVCIHVRRGDMAIESSRETGYRVADVSYIHKAKQYFEQKYPSVIFIVLSDDMTWCKQNLKRNIIFSPFKNPGDDMALMTLCDHVIVTSGSFGWWGAWLSGGTTVYFKHSVQENSSLDRGMVVQDHFPPHWIPM